MSAEALFKRRSGSWRHNTKLSTALAWITLWANSGLCLAIKPKAHAAASLTPVSNSSKHPTNGSNAPLFTTSSANKALCLATLLKT